MGRLRFQLVLVFLFGFTLFFSLYCGLPFDFIYDLLRDTHVTDTLTYADIFRFILNPFTPGWFFFPKMEVLRPIYFLFHKFFFEAFGPTLAPAHFVIAIGQGLLSCVFFFIIYRITGRKVLAWLIVLLYASFPTNASMVAGYLAMDFQFFLSLIVLTAMGILLCITWKTPCSNTQRFLLAIVWIALTWIAIKWKSSEKILPFIYLAFLLLRSKKIGQRLGYKHWTALLILNLFMFVLVIPIPMQHRASVVTDQNNIQVHETFTSKDQRMFHFGIQNVIARVFVMPESENPLLKIKLRNSPTSFTGDLGFLLGWFFWVTLAASLYLCRRNKGPHFETQNHCFSLIAVWFFMILASFASGAPLGEFRYLNFALVPAMLLLGFMVHLWATAAPALAQRKTIFTALLCAIFGFTILQNFTFLFKWVGHFGGMQHVLFQSEEKMHQEFYHVQPKIMEIYEKHHDLESRAVVVGWYNLKEDWLEQALKKLKNEKILFIKIRTEDDYTLQPFRDRHFRVEKMATFPFHDAQPLFFEVYRWARMFGALSNTGKDIVLYKITYP